MEEQLISFETAKMAKEKGFNARCYAYYEVDKEPWLHYSVNSPVDYNHVKDTRHLFSAPTQSLLQKWLREEHGLNINIEHRAYVNRYVFTITKKGVHNDYENHYLVKHVLQKIDHYEEALELGLQNALKLISPETS